MKALSLSQPWCWAVMHELVRKHIENRTWQPPIEMIGQVIAIHAAKSWDDKKLYPVYVDAQRIEARTPMGYLLHWGFEPPSRKELYPVGIVGVATIDRIVSKRDTLPEDQQRWFFGPFGWVLTNVRRIATPIPHGGKQGLWTVPPELEAGIQEQLAA